MSVNFFLILTVNQLTGSEKILNVKNSKFLTRLDSVYLRPKEWMKFFLAKRDVKGGWTDMLDSRSLGEKYGEKSINFE